MKISYLLFMKKTILIFLTIFMFSTLGAQDDPYADHVKTIDSTLETLYAVISGEKGEKRDWKLFEYLFAKDARLIPTGKNQEGVAGFNTMTPSQYVENAGAYLEANGFFEKEISRTTDRYGNIVQAFSTYESYHSEKDNAPFARGINSIQLWFDGNRWWIMTVFWEAETDENPIPEEYLDQ